MLATIQESYTLQTAGSELIPLSKFSKTIGRAIQLTRPYSNSNSRGKEYQGHKNRFVQTNLIRVPKNYIRRRNFVAIMQELC